MAKANVYNMAGQQVGEIELSEAVFGLDPKLFADKKAPSKALFDPTTGALVEFGPAN